MYTKLKPILISGAGIAGLAMARLCGKASIPYKLIEKAPKAIVAGAGIALPANAVSLLDYMGLGSIIKDSAHEVKSVTYATPSQILSQRSLEQPPFNTNKFLALPRSKLHDVLTSGVDGTISYSSEISSMIENGDSVLVNYTEEGVTTQEEFSLVVGADGIHSSLRKAVFYDSPPNEFGLTIWRWTCKWDVKESATEPFYMFDRDRAFMVYPISSDKVYCYAHAVDTSDCLFSKNTSRESIDSLFSHCTHKIIQSALTQLPENPSIIFGKMQSVEQPQFSKGRFVLIGDASHACTPMLQQGAALAFEDAIILTKFLENFPQKLALSLYKEFRCAAVTNTVQASNAPIRSMVQPDFDIEAMYSNIRKNGPLNMQGWEKILTPEVDLLSALDIFIATKKTDAQGKLPFFCRDSNYKESIEEGVSYLMPDYNDSISADKVTTQPK